MTTKRPATRLVHCGEDVGSGAVAPLTTPIYETTTFVFESAAQVQAYQEGRAKTYLYSRYENPTVASAEAKVAALDGAEKALVFSSGMGATATTLLTLLQAGDELVCSAAIYGGTLHLIEDVLVKAGIAARFVTLDELAEPEGVIGPQTRVLWFETPINPTLRCVDIRRVAAACRSRHVT